jgi:branched-chain amino acid transport system substrate-binding protein
VGNVRSRSLTAGSIVAVLAMLLAACSAGSSGSSGSQASRDPIVVGSTLSLTGVFAATGIIHKIAGEEFVDRLNKSGGLLGRPVKWTVLDDESDQAKVATLYERLITQERVDLLIGPYATPNIISAVAVAERHGYTLPQHTAVLAPLLTYKCQFPAWSIGPAPNEYVPNQLFDALASLPNPPKRIAILTNRNGSTDFVSYGTPDKGIQTGAVSVAKARGLDVVLEVRYAPDTTDWAPIAAQVRDAHPDFVLNDGLGVDPVNLVQAMQQLNYRPPMLFSLFPAPGPLLGLGKATEGMLSVSLFEPNKPLLGKAGPGAQEIVDEFQTRAKAAKLPYTTFETQAAASWNAWEILADGVKAAGKLDQQAICDSLHQRGADTTFSGHLTFDPKTNNFWPTTLGLKQIQDGDWVMVWPADRAAAQLRPPGD